MSSLNAIDLERVDEPNDPLVVFLRPFLANQQVILGVDTGLQDFVLEELEIFLFIDGYHHSIGNVLEWRVFVPEELIRVKVEGSACPAKELSETKDEDVLFLRC